MLKQIVVWALLLVGSAGSLTAQSNERLDELLSQAQARLDSTSYLLLASAGLVAEDSEPLKAFEAAMESGLISKARRPEDLVTIEELSYLVMKTQKIPGGVVWSLLPNPRSAYRELSFRGVINASAGPARLVAGDEVVRTLNGALGLKGGQE